jgi:hypothetical protein
VARYYDRNAPPPKRGKLDGDRDHILEANDAPAQKSAHDQFAVPDRNPGARDPRCRNNSQHRCEAGNTASRS